MRQAGSISPPPPAPPSDEGVSGGAVVSALTDTRGLPGTPFSHIVEHDPVKSARRFFGEEEALEEGGGLRDVRRSGSFLTGSVCECRWSTALLPSDPWRG